MVVTQVNLYKNICFYKYAHDLGPEGSPDVILIAFHLRFHACKNGIPPRACRPPTTNPENSKTRTHQEMGPPPARPPERRLWGAQPLWEQEEGGYEPRHPCPLYRVTSLLTRGATIKTSLPNPKGDASRGTGGREEKGEGRGER